MYIHLPFCGNVETAFHYFFECARYAIYRDILFTDTLFVHSLSLMTILHGDENLSGNQNIDLHKAVSNYILSTSRFC